MSEREKVSSLGPLAALAGGMLAIGVPVLAESHVLPPSAFRSGTNGAGFRTDVRLLDRGTGPVTVNAVFYDQVTSKTVTANRSRSRRGARRPSTTSCRPSSAGS